MNHQQKDHQKRKIFTCSVCKDTFRFRYILMEHLSNIHNRTIVDSEASFYKCFICMRGFSSQHRKPFLQHLSEHNTSKGFCFDCNVNLESLNHLESHRERSHQDFSLLADKNRSQPTREAPRTEIKTLPKASPRKLQRVETLKRDSFQPPPTQHIEVQEEPEQFTSLEDDSQQQIMVQTEDGSLLNMNNFILTENGELIIQNLDGLLPNGQEGGDDSGGGQIHISNLEQFLLEQGLSGNAEISYIQPDDNQVIIQNDDGTINQSSQESLMQTYKEIFEPDENIPAELMTAPVSDDSVLLNGDYISMTTIGTHSNNGQIAHQVEVQNNAQVDANQSTLDELGDILLEVAAAAEKEKKPKVIQQKIVREALWGSSKKRPADASVNNGSSKKRSAAKAESKPEEDEPPASNFSQAYEYFVKGFDAKKHKML